MEAVAAAGAAGATGQAIIGLVAIAFIAFLAGIFTMVGVQKMINLALDRLGGQSKPAAPPSAETLAAEAVDQMKLLNQRLDTISSKTSKGA